MQHPISKRSKAALAALAVGSLMTLAACGSDGTQPAAGADTGSGSDSTKTIVFSPLGLKIPAMQQLSEGVQAYGKSKGYDVIVQDPNMDPQKQITDLQSVIETGKADGVWAIMVAPETASALVKTAQEKGVPMLAQRRPRGVRPQRHAGRPDLRHDRLRRPGQGPRRGARQLHQREARRQGRGDLRGEPARQSPARRTSRVPPRRRSPRPRPTPRSSPPWSSRTAPRPRPTSAAPCRATPT